MKVRTDADLEQCERLARVIHALDGYPRYLPGDLRGFIASPDSYVAWVVEHGGEIVGHVALHRRSSPEALAVASDILDQPSDRLGVIARLFVSPEARNLGVGRSLLHVATQEAIDRGLCPMLDVVTDHHAAINLYESCGWIRAGEITVRFKDGNSLDEYVYIAPHPAVADSMHPLELLQDP